jgi:hypothetical protein
MDKLKKALKLNSIFSSVSGIIFILLNNQISNLFGTENNTVFWIIGLILIYFSITIWFEISRQRKIAVLWIIIQDYLWVLGSFILILLNPFNITLAGNIITGIIALIVLFMGINQTIAINKIKK